MREVYKKTQRDTTCMAYFLLFAIYFHLVVSYMQHDNFYLLLAVFFTVQLFYVNKMQKNNKKKLQEVYLMEVLGKH